MKKWGILVGLLATVWSAQAAALPDNMYMKAMQDEVKRSMAKLRRPGVEKPYFIAYKLEQVDESPLVEASLGALYPLQQRDSQLTAYAWVDIGNAQKDSLGYKNDGYYGDYAYRPRRATDVSKSYDGIRYALWQLTDLAYTFAAETYQQKQAYERTKQAQQKDPVPDVIPAKQATYAEEIPVAPAYDIDQLQSWVKQQSAQGKAYPFLEQFTVTVAPVRRTTYYLNSRGGFYQKSLPAVQVKWMARMRDKDGFKRKYSRSLWLSGFSTTEQALAATRTTDFLRDLQVSYQAVRAEDYVGPVLIRPAAAGNFIYEQLVSNLQNLKGLLSSSKEMDPTMGRFSNEQKRVMAPGITVWDKPLQRIDGDIPLGGFMPVDDEGVAAKELKLVEQGRVVALPRTTRPLEDKKPSNGHAVATRKSFPRERLTNVRVEPEEPLAWNALVDQFLARCKELGLDYGYVLHEWPSPANDNKPVLERVYLDGKSEFVYGLKIEGLTTRSLRDILAAGDSPVVTHIEEEYVKGLPSQSVSAPALLLEEMEFTSIEAKPDKKTFVPKP